MIHTPATASTLGLLLAAPLLAQPDTIRVERDDTVIDRSCTVVIPAGTVIADANNNGVIQITADNITVVFADKQAELMGVAKGTPWDQCAGIGIRIDGRKNVTLKNAHSHGYKVNIWATNADGLVLDGCDVAEGYAQHLKSTPSAEDGADWLWPHKNDDHEWATNYGAAIYIERSSNVTVKDCHARRRQNGIVLDRVTDSKVYDNDCSFLSGWGLAMWRCTGNTISRNAFDFCVRGHVEGVYNRGQDSAGILFFEQNSNNIFAENSATHGGDGFFAFAGLEALNGEGAPPGFDHTRKGCNDNLLIDNDFSYAPAHGIEMTFSFGNKFIRNRLVENAICGVWGGYSQDTLIADNTFEGNGGMAYGLERGGVNIEHGVGNIIVNNRFVNNMCAVHLWWRDNGDFASKTWGKANYKGVLNNTIAGNTLIMNDQHPFTRMRADGKMLGLQLREDPASDGAKVVGTGYFGNTSVIDTPRAEELAITDGIQVAKQGTTPKYTIPKYEVFGKTHPVGARTNLRGRDKIVMTEWGPWDHESPLVRLVSESNGTRTYEAFGYAPGDIKVSGEGVRGEVKPGATGGGAIVTVTSSGPGVHAYTLTATGAKKMQEIHATLVSVQWDAVFFAWPAPEPRHDAQGTPRIPPDLAAWRQLSQSGGAVRAKLGAIKFPYGGRGPADVVDDPAVKASGLKGDYFGMIARTELPLTKGKWRIKTSSDDGIRVIVDGKTVIEDWTHHGPTPHEAEFTIDRDSTVKVLIEHFEIMGAAAMEFEIEAAS